MTGVQRTLQGIRGSDVARARRPAGRPCRFVTVFVMSGRFGPSASIRSRSGREPGRLPERRGQKHPSRRDHRMHSTHLTDVIERVPVENDQVGAFARRQ